MKLGQLKDHLRGGEVVVPKAAELPAWARVASMGSATDEWQQLTGGECEPGAVLYSRPHDRLVYVGNGSDDGKVRRVHAYLEGRRYKSWVLEFHLYRVPLEQCAMCDGEPRHKFSPRCISCGGLLVQIGGDVDGQRRKVDMDGLLLPPGPTLVAMPISVAEQEGTNEEHIEALANVPLFSAEHDAMVLGIGGFFLDVINSKPRIVVRVNPSSSARSPAVAYTANVASDALFHVDRYDCGWCDGSGKAAHPVSTVGKDGDHPCPFCDGVGKWPLPGELARIRALLAKQPRFADFIDGDEDGEAAFAERLRRKLAARTAR